MIIITLLCKSLKKGGIKLALIFFWQVMTLTSKFARWYHSGVKDRVDLTRKTGEVISVFNDFIDRLKGIDQSTNGLRAAADLTLATSISGRSSDEIFELFNEIRNSSEILGIQSDVSAKLTLACVTSVLPLSDEV